MLTPLRPRWARPAVPPAPAVRALVDALRLPPLVCEVLAVRGQTDVEAAKRFLRPLLEHLHDPGSLADGAVGARRIAAAVRAGETILVHGDYDVDGMCATALLTRFLRHLGGRVVPFVPHRLRDGYDFGEAGLAAAVEARAHVVVTADCGTSALDAVARARSAGLDVIVTDHHTPGPAAPAATAFVNPRRADCPYPEPALCGAAVAFKVAELVARELGADDAPLFELLDLVALATVADLVPLEGENRVLVRHGLRRFARSRVLGIRALLDASGVDPEEVTAGKLGFVVAPRLNAAGRLGEASDALRLLLTEDSGEARRLASRLERLNGLRREEDRRTLDRALEQLEAGFDPGRDYGVVLAADGWHPGVIGIVASRVVERIHRPVVMVALDGASGRGSGRSIPGFHLFDALNACSEHLRRFGGHRQAAGLDLDRTALPAFRERFNQEARERLGDADLRPVLRPDVELDLGVVDLDLLHWLEYLGPHGIGNPRPVFLARGIDVDRPRVLKRAHLKATLRSGSDRLDGIGFGLAAAHAPPTLAEGPHDVLLKLERNEWRGVVRAQGRILDLRRSAEGDP